MLVVFATSRLVSIFSDRFDIDLHLGYGRGSLVTVCIRRDGISRYFRFRHRRCMRRISGVSASGGGVFIRVSDGISRELFSLLLECRDSIGLCFTAYSLDGSISHQERHIV